MKRVIFKMTLSLVVLSLTAFGGYQAVDKVQFEVRNAWENVKSKWESKFSKTVFVPVEAKEKSLADIIKHTATRYRLPRILIASLIQQESGGDFKSNRLRFEPDVFTRVKPKAWQTEMESKMQATSIGLAQIIPFFHGGKRVECPLDWSKYLDPEINLDCAGAILRECLDKQNKGTYQNIRICLGFYNGDRSGNYADEVLGRIARMTIEGMIL